MPNVSDCPDTGRRFDGLLVGRQDHPERSDTRRRLDELHSPWQQRLPDGPDSRGRVDDIWIRWEHAPNSANAWGWVDYVRKASHAALIVASPSKTKHAWFFSASWHALAGDTPEEAARALGYERLQRTRQA